MNIRILFITCLTMLLPGCQEDSLISKGKIYKLPPKLTNNRIRYLGQKLSNIKDSASLSHEYILDEDVYDETIKPGIFNSIIYQKIKGWPKRAYSLSLVASDGMTDSVFQIVYSECVQEYGTNVKIDSAFKDTLGLHFCNYNWELDPIAVASLCRKRNMKYSMNEISVMLFVYDKSLISPTK